LAIGKRSSLFFLSTNDDGGKKFVVSRLVREIAIAMFHSNIECSVWRGEIRECSWNLSVENSNLQSQWKQ